MNNEIGLTFLRFLEVEKKENPQELLREIIQKFQIKVPFETATKILTYKSMLQNNNLYYHSSLREYIENLRTYGYGGTCFNFTKGLFDLLITLGYQVKIIYLEPGHFCLAVKVDHIEFYVDVGFMAPLFELYPLREDWEVNKYNESIKWEYKNGKGTLTLHNGYTKKVWNGQYVDNSSFMNSWKESYNGNSSFLRNTFITKWRNLEEIVTVQERRFKRFYKGTRAEDIVLEGDKDLEKVLIDLFNVDPTFYFTALKEKKGMVNS